MLNTFVAFTTSVFSASYIAHELETGRLTPLHLRFYHAMYQILLFAMNLALVANNIGLMWVAIEMATLTTVAMVGIYRTQEAIEAAWKYFILGSVGIALALFGTILVYMAARPVVGEGLDGMVWTILIQRVAEFDPALLNLAFVFLMLGYGTKVGLAPLHAWLPDAHAEGPTPISAVLSGLLLNVALYAVLRFKLLLDANPGAIAPGPLMATLGLVSLIFAAFMLYRRRDIKRLFAFSSIEHMGIIVFAFGMGGALANFAGLLHMTMHSLTKSAIFFTVGHIAQVKGTQKISAITGLTVSQPWLGWSLVVGVFAIAGLPPLGVFMSEFLVVTSTFARSPALALALVFGLLLAFGALMLRLQGMAFGEPTRGRQALDRLVAADRRASRPGAARRDLSAAAAGRLVPARRRDAAMSEERRHRERSGARATAAASSRRRGDARQPLAADRLRRPHGASRRHMALARRWTVLRLACPEGAFPSVGAAHPPAIRLERAIADLFGLQAIGAPDPRPWLDHGTWPVRAPLGARASRRRAAAQIRVPRRRGRRPASNSGRARCMPASSSPAISAFTPAARRSSGWRRGSAMSTRASNALMRGATLERAAALAARVPATDGRLCDRFCPRRRSRARGASRRRARSGCAR